MTGAIDTSTFTQKPLQQACVCVKERVGIGNTPLSLTETRVDSLLLDDRRSFGDAIVPLILIIISLF